MSGGAPVTKMTQARAAVGGASPEAILDPRRSFSGGSRWPRCGGALEPRRRRGCRGSAPGGATWRRRLGFGLRCGVDGRGAGVRIPFIGRRTLGCVLGTRAQRGDHGESVPRGRRAGEEGADPWGRAVSGVGRRGLSGMLRERGGETGLRLGRAELGQAGACAGSAGRPSGGAGLAAGKGRGERGPGRSGPQERKWAVGK